MPKPPLNRRQQRFGLERLVGDDRRSKAGGFEIIVCVKRPSYTCLHSTHHTEPIIRCFRLQQGRAEPDKACSYASHVDMGEPYN